MQKNGTNTATAMVPVPVRWCCCSLTKKDAATRAVIGRLVTDMATSRTSTKIKKSTATNTDVMTTTIEKNRWTRRVWA